MGVWVTLYACVLQAPYTPTQVITASLLKVQVQWPHMQQLYKCTRRGGQWQVELIKSIPFVVLGLAYTGLGWLSE